jgi:hypothetical protein
MSTNNDPIRSRHGPGVWGNLANYFKLIFRLMGDRRVNPLLKLLPIATLIYLFAPDFIPLPFDDALVIWIGTVLFIELCPPNVVDEHRNALKKAYQTTENPQGEVIDAEFKEEKDD